ncbi:unnamed protein product [Caenorhabditis sp. 36 PRJEB53466]|nr:unnamed protein product [Caenorhabditis sp. 36 PRJEB53466]
MSTADSRVLRPCFERYANHRLVNVRPYHSEWRMPTEDMCLLFCAQSASRCRSVVYDTVQHICHYFSDEGVDQAVISAKMTYLRVVSRSCLQENAENAADPNVSPPDSPPVLLTSSFTNNEIQQELAIPQPPIEIPTQQPATELPMTTTETSEAPAMPEVVTFESATQPMIQNNDDEDLTGTTESVLDIDETDLDKELKSVMEPSQFTGSFSEGDAQVENNGVYRDKAASEQRWMDSMEKMDAKPSGKKTIGEKLEELKTEDRQKYEMLMGEKAEDEEVEEEKQKLKNSLRYGAKVIQFDEEAAFRKQSELRRKPAGATKRPALKPVTISSTSYIQKAKSFLDEVNEADEVRTGDIVTTECRSDDVDVWIAFENSEQADESADEQIDSNVPSRRECQKICQQQNCRSFTYFEKTHACHLSTIERSHPASSIFDGCSNFVAFRDYSVRIEAVEEFDGLPRGYEGMQLCIELCVLSTRYTCRSSTFNPITGKCRLLTEDSLSSPDEFKYDEFQKDLYFENGCTSAGNDSSDFIGRNVEIVPVKPKKLKKKLRRVKKLRRRH